MRALKLGYGFSGYSNEATCATFPLPPAPTNLTCQLVSTATVLLGWKDNATNETHNRVERKTGNGDFTLIATPGANATSYLDSNLAPDQNFTYRVNCVNTQDYSAYSGTAFCSTVSPPAAPSNLACQSLNGPAVKLTWTDNSANEVGFHIEAKTGAGSYTLLKIAPSDTSSSTVTGLAASTTYTLRINAYNSGGTSAYSNEVTCSTIAGADRAGPA